MKQPAMPNRAVCLSAAGFAPSSCSLRVVGTILWCVQMLEAVLNVCNQNARIPACGMISQYNVPDKEGVRNLFAVGLGLPTLPLTCCR